MARSGARASGDAASEISGEYFAKDPHVFGQECQWRAFVQVGFGRTRCEERRREDLDRIKELRASMADKSAKLAEAQGRNEELEARMQQLHGEMLLRESNYNRCTSRQILK